MTSPPAFRDIEQLSAYLDGMLSRSEAEAIEARLAASRELSDALLELRQARDLLRRLPARRAPRNFTLSPRMVGSKPPLPHSYPVFRFATVAASVLLFLTFATNFVAPRVQPRYAAAPYGYGGGGGGEAESAAPVMEMPAPEEPAEPAEPAAPQEPAAAAEEALEEPAAPQAGDEALAVTPTAAVEGEVLRAAPSPAATQGALDQAKVNGATPQPAPTWTPPPTQVPAPPEPEPPERPFTPALQAGLATLALASGLVVLVQRRAAAARWRKTR